MTICSVTILDSEGSILITRNFLGYTTMAELTLLRTFVLAGDLTEPIIKINGKIYCHHKLPELHIFSKTSAMGDAMAAGIF